MWAAGRTIISRNCSELDQLALPDIRIHEAVASSGEEAEDATSPPDGVPSRQRKAVVPHCKVDGTIGDEINFELLLPEEFLYNVQRIFSDRANPTESVITPDNRRLLQSTILEQCDRLDGVEDGILDDPRECTFKLSSLPKCPGGGPAAHCLTVAQQEAIAGVYDGPRNQDGPIFPGIPFGGENEAAAWQQWITGPYSQLIEVAGEPSLQFGFGTQGFKYLIFRDPEFDYTRYDFATFESDSELFSSFADATNSDLSEFQKAGGKLILWHGWADAALTALASIDYFEAAESRDAAVRDYFRLYMVPGFFHCAGGPGPDRVDWIDAIENWVERDEAPKRLTAYRVADDKVDMTRPLCVFPQRAVYKGSGSTDEAANFECRDPEG